VNLGSEEAIPGLIAGLDDDQPHVRSMAAANLGRMNRTEATDRIRVLLRDPEVYVRQSAATALAWMGDCSGVNRILANPSPIVELNGLRRPDVCRAWRTKILTGPPITASNREVLEEVCKRAGIALELPADLAWTPYTNFVALEGKDLLSVVSSHLWQTGGAVIEDGKLRVLTPREGRQFWRRWWAEEQINSARADDRQEGRKLLAEIEASDRRREAWMKERAAARSSPPEDVKALLTPFLRGVPGLEDQLVKGGAEAWTRAFLKAAQAYAHSEYQGVKDEDLNALAPRALRGALAGPEMIQVLQFGAGRRLDALRPLADEYLKHQDPDVRVASASLILTLDGPSSLSRTLFLLDDPDGRARQGMVTALGALRMVEAAPHVRSRKDDPSIQSGLLLAASGLEMEEFLPLLLSKAKKIRGGPDDYMTRLNLGSHLSTLGNPSISGEIRECLKTEDHPNAVDNLVRILAKWGCREAIPDLVDLLKKPRQMNDLYSHAVFQTLTTLGAREASETILSHLKEGSTLHAAAAAAAELGLVEAIPPLRKLLESKNEATISTAAGALAKLGDRNGIPRLRQLLGHASPDVRGSACLALALLGDRESTPQILAIARDPKGFPLSVSEALAVLRTPEARALLAGRNIHATPRYLAAIAGGGEEVLTALRRRMEDPDLWKRCAGVELIGRIGGDEVTADLRRMLRDETVEVRRSAAGMLCRRGFAEGVPLTWDRTRQRFAPLPFALNGVRIPTVWAKLQSATLTEPFYGPVKDLVGRVAAAAGLPLEGLPASSREYPAWAGVYVRVYEADLPLRGIDALDLAWQERWMIVLESDRLRILPRREAIDFWKGWMGQEKK
jgi:HEAT repeat protein